MSARGLWFYLTTGALAVPAIWLINSPKMVDEKMRCLDLHYEAIINGLPVPLDLYSEIMARNGWKVNSRVPKAHNTQLLVSRPTDKNVCYKFLWIVIPDGKRQIFDSGLGNYRFEVIQPGPFLNKTYTLKNGETTTFTLCKRVPVIKTPGSFTMFGSVSVMKNQQKMVKLLNELLCEVEEGRVVKTWYTERVTTVEFARHRKEKRLSWASRRFSWSISTKRLH